MALVHRARSLAFTFVPTVFKAKERLLVFKAKKQGLKHALRSLPHTQIFSRHGIVAARKDFCIGDCLFSQSIKMTQGYAARGILGKKVTIHSQFPTLCRMQRRLGSKLIRNLGINVGHLILPGRFCCLL